MKFNYRTIQISMKKYINILIIYFILSHCTGCNKDKISDLKKDFPTMELIQPLILLIWKAKACCCRLMYEALTRVSCFQTYGPKIMLLF